MNFGIWQIATSAINASVQAAQAAAAAAQTAAANAMSQATSASTAASSASTTASGAAASAASLQAAVDAGNATHTDLYNKIGAKLGYLATAYATTPVLALNGQQDITFTLTRAMPTTTYNIDVLPAPSLIGSCTITLKSQTKTQVIFTVKATVAVGAAAISVVATSS